jgi:hypothetical protein
MKTKGLPVDIYKSSLGDCTNKGISSDKTELILTRWEIAGHMIDCPKLFTGDETNSVEIIENVPGHHCAVPLVHPKNMVGPMFGGHFAYSSDSRFPFKYPVPIHDRFEFLI